MKAYIYQILVDTYGNIPYTQALQGDKGILKPAYDAQQAIYEDLVIQLDTAMNIISTTPADVEALGANRYYLSMVIWENGLNLPILLN